MSECWSHKMLTHLFQFCWTWRDHTVISFGSTGVLQVDRESTLKAKALIKVNMRLRGAKRSHWVYHTKIQRVKLSSYPNATCYWAFIKPEESSQCKLEARSSTTVWHCSLPLSHQPWGHGVRGGEGLAALEHTRSEIEHRDSQWSRHQHRAWAKWGISARHSDRGSQTVAELQHASVRWQYLGQGPQYWVRRLS